MTDKETQRLNKLKTYNILDSSHDPSFDKITKLASAICQKPIALISLIDENRQWFKSMVGLSGISETPRNISFCTFTIKGDGILEIKDATQDERFRNNPLVINDPNIRFYAGAPLTSPEGLNLGTLCVIDKKPSELSPSQAEALKILSDQVVELMELRKTNVELREAKKLLEEQQQLMVNKARLQTIGELAGGVCHQINNPLAIITGRSMILRSVIKQKLPGDTDILRELDVIDQTSLRVSGILKALRMYSKDFGNQITEEGLLDIIENVLTLLKSKLQKERVEVELNRNLDPRVFVNKNQISQVLLDMINNSIEAMEESQNKKVQINVSVDNKNVYVSVTDSGKGIRLEDKDKIFEPFFTTKGRHFGVGLSNALNFIKQNKGVLKLTSPANPTVFELQIPKSA